MKAKRILALIVTALMLLTSFALPGPLSAVREAEAASLDQAASAPAAKERPVEKDDDDYYDDEGWCGPNLYWDFYEYSGELIITGSGRMYNYEEDGNPWCENGFASKVKSVSLPKGITNLGTYAFYSLTALKEIILPSTVKAIDESAFEECTSLQSITLPKSVTAIGPWAFYHCNSLKNVYYQSKAEDAVKIVIQRGNSWLLNAAWHYSKPNTATLKIKTQPKSVKVDEGKTATFKVKAAGATRIEWEYQEPGQTGWTSLYVTGDTLTVMGTTLYDGYSYHAKVSNGTATLTSSPATLTVKPVVLKIKTHPKTVKTDEYKTVTFKVKAVGAIHFQWQSWYPGDSRWYDMEGATSDTLSLFVESYEDDASFRCAVSNDRGDVEYSNPAKVYLKLSIQEQPKSVTTEEGTAAWFYVDAAGATDYQWQYLMPGRKEWTDWSGHTDSYVGVGGTLNNNGYSFRCRVSNASATKYTKAAKLTVNPKVHYRALLIGESNYSSKPLAGGVYNADTMAGMLRGLNNSFTTTTLKNASSTQIINGISTAFAGASDYDVSLFYYSGHGAESSSTYYLGALCPVSGYSIPFDDLAWELSKVKGKVIVILDSCHSGAAIGKSVGDDKAAAARLDAYNQSAIDAFSGYRLESGDGETGKWKELATSKFVVITSASSSEVCWNRIVNYGYDGNSYPQGLFTAAFIKGMGCSYPNGYYSGNRMPADKNKDNVITLKEIYNYVYDLALVWTKSNGLSAQHTKFYGNASEVLFRRK